MKITVPTSLADITLGTFMKYEAEKDPKRRVAILLGIDYETFRSIETPSLDEINTLLTAVNTTGGGDHPLQKIIEVRGLKMGFVPDLHRISLGEFADLETLCQDAFNNLPQIIAVLYRPVTGGGTYEYTVAPYTGREKSDWALDCTMDVVLGALDFFLRIGLEFSRASLQSLKATGQVPA